MRLISVIPLQHVKLLSGGWKDAVREAATHVAFDDEGRPWFLVNRYERISEDAKGRRLLRVTFARWHRGEGRPFVSEPPLDLSTDVRLESRLVSDE